MRSNFSHINTTLQSSIKKKNTLPYSQFITKKQTLLFIKKKNKQTLSNSQICHFATIKIQPIILFPFFIRGMIVYLFFLRWPFIQVCLSFYETINWVVDKFHLNKEAIAILLTKKKKGSNCYMMRKVNGQDWVSIFLFFFGWKIMVFFFWWKKIMVFLSILLEETQWEEQQV